MSEKNLVRQAWIWLASPVMLFIAFWFRTEVALPTLLILCHCLWNLLWRQSSYMHTTAFRDTPRKHQTYAALIVVAAYVTVSGIGGFVAQMPNDHAWRNATFYDLSRHTWPVTYGPEPDAPMLCYYFAFWLPSAIVSKATGFIMAGDAAQLIYAIWGTWIALNLIVSMCGYKALWSTIAIFIFFNAFDWVTSSFFSDEYYSIFESPWAPQLTWLSTTSDRFSASANPIVYNFIYNQGIPLWVFSTLLLHERARTGHLMLLLSLLPAYAPIPALAFIPWVSARLIGNFRKAMTLPNVTGIVIALLTASFLLQNNSSGHFRIVTYNGSIAQQLILAATYYTISFAPFIPFIWRYVRHDGLYWSLIVMAVSMSIFGIGTGSDLAWRITLPAVMMTTIMLCKRCSTILLPGTWRDRTLIAVLLAGSFSSIYTLAYTIYSETLIAQGERERKLIYIMGKLDNRTQGPNYNNFIAEGKSFYRQWLMPRQEHMYSHKQLKPLFDKP